MNNTKMFLKSATIEDMELLFKWANDAEVRKNSFSSDEISWEEHKKWFTNVLADKNKRIFLFYIDDVPVGQIRLTVSGKEAAISYSISKEYRSMGYGKLMINELTGKIGEIFPDIEKLVAHIKPENIASRKVFMDNGYNEKELVYELNTKGMFSRNG